MAQQETLAKVISVFAYDDYRRFLKDWFAAAKQSRRGMSFRAFSRRAGLASPNFLQLVMEKKRNLSEEGITKFIAGLGLNKGEGDYFRNLVGYVQAKTEEEKFCRYGLMVKSKKFSELRPVEKDQFLLYSSWLHPVIRELIEFPHFNGRLQWLRDHILPLVAEREVEQSIALLERLGFIHRDGKKWKRAVSTVTTGVEAESFLLTSYHQSLLRLSADLFPHVPAESRDISALTIGLRRADLVRLKQRVQAFRRELMKEFSDSDPPEDVVVLNIQLLPLTKGTKP